jgi:hypothetical protein
VLRKALLSCYLETEDIPANILIVPRRAIPWANIIAKEVFTATYQVLSTSLGADEIPIAAFRLA